MNHIMTSVCKTTQDTAGPVPTVGARWLGDWKGGRGFDALMERAAQTNNQYLQGGWKFPQLPKWLSGGVWLFSTALPSSHSMRSPRRFLSYRLKRRESSRTESHAVGNPHPPPPPTHQVTFFLLYLISAVLRVRIGLRLERIDALASQSPLLPRELLNEGHIPPLHPGSVAASGRFLYYVLMERPRDQCRLYPLTPTFQFAFSVWYAVLRMCWLALLHHV